MLTAEFPGKLNLISCLLQSTGLYFGMWTAAASYGYGGEPRACSGVQRARARRSTLRRTRAEERGCGQNSGPEQGRFKNIVLAILVIPHHVSTFVSPDYIRCRIKTVREGERCAASSSDFRDYYEYCKAVLPDCIIYNSKYTRTMRFN